MTFHFAWNHGAVLQAYALQSYLRAKGHEAELVDYRPTYMTDGGPLVFPRNKKQLIGNAQSLFIRYHKWRGKAVDRPAVERFSHFVSKHLACSPKKYSTWEELREAPPRYDAYLCGSDQIWNPPPRRGVDPAYYLDFAPAGCGRIAYAASFGRASVDEEYRPLIGALLKRLDRVSVRERSGVDLVRTLSGRQAFWTPDPTLLLDDYRAITTAPKEGAFVFTYCLMEPQLTDAVQRRVAQKLGLLCVTPRIAFHRWRFNAEERIMGPSEWLGHIQQARFVVTTSFRGTLFSILLKKPFIAVGLAGAKSALSERLVSVLSRLRLSERFVRDYNEAEIDRLILRPINWESVGETLSFWRDEADAFLSESLRG